MPTDEQTDKEIYGHAQAISWKEHIDRHTDLTHIPVKLNVGWLAGCVIFQKAKEGAAELKERKKIF